MAEFQGKTILVTGGTGSFGGYFVNFLLDKNFEEIRVFSRDELKQEEMRLKFQNPKIKFYIGDVRDRDSVDDVMAGVDYVFHAAALKQVPTCEFFPMQATQTNVLGSQNVINSAISHGVSRVVSLSTDKAVYPVNALGITKALMEKVVQSASRKLSEGQTILTLVRYGNVLFSRGSVIPLFMKLMREKKPLTVTEPGMTRFLLPLKEAINLVGFALGNGKQGDIFVRNAPSCSVGDLAQALKNILGSDSEIQTIGMRHGEKMHETLASQEELLRSEDMGDYLRLSMDDRDLNYNKYLSEGDKKFEKVEDYTSQNTVRLTVKEIEKMLLEQPEIISELNQNK
ncbi:MAG: polysaccharide biosynthesis protein [Nitrospina sp.]|jgi:UDP-N-acetylglucosamine 4,6-dehydratase/5-epimerase|nr:polysaccharide biosynthesis protein [Nitrospina sp.]MBT3875003.1 polysaccharide biosynthesis protein [Nitrospina sp.]MBT4049654.1 polysaccharide biosynthesis protein [Nitrospina sp.]MBT4556349.1 polysaccharide biosynthesis protein [Nitrospina sp.]MBT5348168.1 polysaccharide biosynthesis protein [Nitrospina sp.]